MPSNNRYLNPVKRFRFKVTIYDPSDKLLEPFYVQEVTLPEKSLEVEEHGHGATVIKTPGQVKLTNLTLQRILDAKNGALNHYFEAWMDSCVDARDNFMGDISIFAKDILVEELGIGEGNNTVAIHKFELCYPIMISGKEHSRTSSENIIESVEFAVNFASNTF
jgi:hypothetical protein